MAKKVMRWIWLLPLISGGIVLGCLVYCRFWWTPTSMGLSDPDCSIICWLFCSTMNPLWFNLGILFSSTSLLGGIMMRYNIRRARLMTLIGGILIFPTGLINLIPYYYYKSPVRWVCYRFCYSKHKKSIVKASSCYIIFESRPRLRPFCC